MWFRNELSSLAEVSLYSSCRTRMVRISRFTVLLEFGRKAPLKKAEEPERDERTVTALKLTKDLGLTGDGSEVCWTVTGSSSWKNVRMLAGCEEILKEKKGSLCRLTFSGHLQGLVHHHPWVGHCRWSACSSVGNFSSLNCGWFVSCNRFHNFS